MDSEQRESEVGSDNVDGQRCTTECRQDTEDKKWADMLRAMCRDSHQVHLLARTLQGVSQHNKVRVHKAAGR